MLLNDGDILVITAALAAQAMAYGKLADQEMKAGNGKKALQFAAFSGECSRVRDLFTKRR